MYRVIMAPTEGSDSEKPAVLAALTLARRFGAVLHLVRVEPAPLVIETIPHPPVLEITQAALHEERLARLRKLEAEAEAYRQSGVRVMASLEDGPVGPALRDYANRSGVDLIVMNSHARGGVKRITLGSVTDYLIRHTHIPVLVVKAGVKLLEGSPTSTVARIVVPLDGSVLAEQILPEVASMALRINATVSLLHVLTPTTYSQERIMQPGLPWWDADMETANAYLSRAATRLAEEGVAVSKDVVIGANVAQSILDYAARARADLLAIATSGAGGMSRFVFGSVADEVKRKSTTSLLVFHAKPTATVSETSAEHKALVEL